LRGFFIWLAILLIIGASAGATLTKKKTAQPVPVS
jgi:threonine/homoserine efflux transporter RhtA